MSKVLVISGHPKIEESYTNKVILDRLQSSGQNVEVRHLADLYPDFQFDIKAEQDALLTADVVVFQFPFYWYSLPGIMKLWLDEVFAFNFSYGPEGDKLKGKHLILSFTVGGPQQSYNPLGYNHFSIEQMLVPIEQTAYLAGMQYHKPIYSHGMIYIPNVYNTKEGVEARANAQAERVIEALKVISESKATEEVIKTFANQWFKDFDELPEDPATFLKSVDEALHLSSPEGIYQGIDGFLQWYKVLRESFKPNPTHDVERVEVSHLEENKYQVDLLVRLGAETYDNGAVNVTAKEVWRVSVDQQKQVKIYDYRVELA